jgi:hypothetical protein
MSAAAATKTAAGRITGGVVAAGVLLGLGMLLLGLPGMAILEFVGPLAGPVGAAAFKAWPAGIYVTQIMPLGVIVSAAALARLKPDTGVLASMLCGLLGYVAMGVAAALALIAMN